MDAQIAFKGETTYKIVGSFFTVSGLLPNMPEVDCPIVDTTKVQSLSLLAAAIHEYVGISGVLDLDLLLDKLERIGATITYPTPPLECTCDPDPNRQSATCPACVAVLNQTKTEELPY